MSPKADPYATKSAPSAVDLLLILLAVAAIAIVILTAPRRHAGADRASVSEIPVLAAR